MRQLMHYKIIYQNWKCKYLFLFEFCVSSPSAWYCAPPQDAMGYMPSLTLSTSIPRGTLPEQKQKAESWSLGGGDCSVAIPLCMRHCPTRLDLQNTDSKVEILRISRWQLQSIKPQALNVTSMKVPVG